MADFELLAIIKRLGVKVRKKTPGIDNLAFL